MTIPVELQKVLSIDEEVMHGKVSFTGTRVPVTVFFDNLADGMGAAEFLEEYPTVTEHQLNVVLKWTMSQAERSLGLEFAS